MAHTRTSDESDADLILASSDNAGRFAVLYDRHIEAVLQFHYRRTGCAHTAADLAAETFAVAFLSRRSFRDVGAPGRAWLFTIARRQLARYVRRERVASRARRRLGVTLNLALDDDEIARIEELADLAPLRSVLAAALAQMPAAQSEAVRMRIVEELSYAELARQLGCSEGAARVRVSRGLTRLGDALEGGQP